MQTAHFLHPRTFVISALACALAVAACAGEPALPPQTAAEAAAQAIAAGAPAPTLTAGVAPPSGEIHIGKSRKSRIRLSGDMPVMTDEARAANVAGKVSIKCTLTEEGVLIDCSIVESLPLLDRVVLDAVAKWKLTPAVVEGKPTAVPFTQDFRFVP